MRGLDTSIGNIYVDDKVKEINEIYKNAGVKLPETHLINAETNLNELRGSMVVGPSSVMKLPNISGFKDKKTSFASGWTSDFWGWRNVDKGFTLSDHADWEGLLFAIKTTEARTIFVHHGFTSYFTKYLKTQGYEAYDTKKLLKEADLIDLF